MTAMTFAALCPLAFPERPESLTWPSDFRVAGKLFANARLARQDWGMPQRTHNPSSRIFRQAPNQAVFQSHVPRMGTRRAATNWRLKGLRKAYPAAARLEAAWRFGQRPEH